MLSVCQPKQQLNVHSIHLHFCLEGFPICPCTSPPSYLVPSWSAFFFPTSSFYQDVADSGRMKNQHSNLIFILTSRKRCKARLLVQKHLKLKAITGELEPSAPHPPPPCKKGICQQAFAHMGVISTAFAVRKSVRRRSATPVFEWFV